MIFGKKKVEDDGVDKIYIETMLDDLNDIYSNKSSDEYKCKGDITASPAYEHIELQLANLSSIKRYPSDDVTALKSLFNVLHRPIFKKLVTEYMAKADERNIVFTGVFTTGYRLLIGELSRIYASTEATDNGFVYKPDKVSRRESLIPMIRKFNVNIEQKLDDVIKRAMKKASPIAEAATLAALGAAAEGVVSVIEGVFGFLNGIFRSATAMNPVALISAVLSRSYDKKVEQELTRIYSTPHFSFINLEKYLRNTTPEAIASFLQVADEISASDGDSSAEERLCIYKIRKYLTDRTGQNYMGHSLSSAANIDLRCPGCAATMEYQPHYNRAVCPFCGNAKLLGGQDN